MPTPGGGPTDGFYTSGLQNANGLAVVMANPNGWLAPNSTAFTVQQNANGSWGQPTSIADAAIFGYLGSATLVAAGINKTGQVLLGSNYPSALVYHPTTKTLTDLQTLQAITNSGYPNLTPIGIDDQGRILVRGQSGPGTDPAAYDTLLLTPDGVSSSPLPMSTPEPGGLLIWGLISVCLAGRFVTRWSRRLAHGAIGVKPCFLFLEPYGSNLVLEPYGSNLVFCFWSHMEP